MSGLDLVQVFTPVITEIISLVQNQIDFCVIQPKAILLVGGFGANSYLREQLKKAFPKIQVMQPANGWTAVARGALTKAMAGASTNICKINITSRIARKYYGMICVNAFNEDKHENWRKNWNEYYGEHMSTVINWLVCKGDIIDESKSVTASFTEVQLVNDGPFKVSICRFYFFDDGVAPMYKDHNVKHLVTLTADLSAIPPYRYRTATGADGEKYYKISYQIKMTFFSARTEYSLVYQNRPYGSVLAEYA